MKYKRIKTFTQNETGLQPLLGFSLAETLITLGIIAVLATMTIPNLIQKQQEKQTVVKLQKAYSTLSNAFTLAVQENGTPDYWELTADDAGAKNLLNKLASHLNVTKNCGTINDSCFGASK